WVRLLSRGPIVGAPEILVHRHVRSDSLTRTNPAIVQSYRALALLEDRRAEMRRWAGRHAASGPPHIHVRIALEHLRARRRAKALRHALHGLRRSHPSRLLALKIAAES